MKKLGLTFGLTSLALANPSPVLADEHKDREALVGAAFDHAQASGAARAFDTVRCVPNQRQIALVNETSLLFPCELQELVEDSSDAAMLVTLLLSEPHENATVFEKEISPEEKAVAVGAALVGAVTDPGSDRVVIERARDNVGIASPSIAAYAPADSRTIKREAARIRREEEAVRMSDPADARARERAREAREREEARQAEYASVTQFLELSNLQGFCPGDGRAFLIRASEYAISPVQDDRPYGLWSDDRRRALEPYLNDLSRCR